MFITPRMHTHTFSHKACALKTQGSLFLQLLAQQYLFFSLWGGTLWAFFRSHIFGLPPFCILTVRASDP